MMPHECSLKVINGMVDPLINYFLNNININLNMDLETRPNTR